MKINNVRGDLSDMSAKTATLIRIHSSSYLFRTFSIPDESG